MCRDHFCQLCKKSPRGAKFTIIPRDENQPLVDTCGLCLTEENRLAGLSKTNPPIYTTIAAMETFRSLALEVNFYPSEVEPFLELHDDATKCSRKGCKGEPEGSFVTLFGTRYYICLSCKRAAWEMVRLYERAFVPSSDREQRELELAEQRAADELESAVSGASKPKKPARAAQTSMGAAIERSRPQLVAATG